MAAQTVVDSVRVTVVAGIVYTPGVGQVVANGVGTTGDGELEGTTGLGVEDATPITMILVSPSSFHTKSIYFQHTRSWPSNGSPDRGATASRLRGRASGQKTSLQMECLMSMTTSSMIPPSINA